jgi:hypothetical protein
MVAWALFWQMVCYFEEKKSLGFVLADGLTIGSLQHEGNCVFMHAHRR